MNRRDSEQERTQASTKPDVINRVLLKINLANQAECPAIKLTCPNLGDNSGTFLVDTGSEISVLKKSALQSGSNVNSHSILELTGINKLVVNAREQIRLLLNEIEGDMHIVPDDFPIPYDGILGAEFLKRYKATLCFNHDNLIINGQEIALINSPRKKIMLPARSKSLIELDVANPSQGEGYVELLDAGQGIFIGNALVSNRDGKCRLFATNSTVDDIMLSVPPVHLYDYSRPSRALYNIKTNTQSEMDRRVELLSDIVDSKSLNKEETDSILKLLREFPYQFHLPGDKLGHVKDVTHRIRTTTDSPINVKQYRNPFALANEIDRQVDKMVKNDVIEPSVSAFNAPAWVVPKRPGPEGEKKWRLEIDYRALNAVTVNDIQPLPHITEILDQLGGAKYFTILDLASGFFQILMSPQDAHKTAFFTSSHRWQFKRLPMGLKGSPSTFVRALTSILAGLQSVDVFIYMDDMVIFSCSLQDHIIKLRKVLARLKAASLQLQPDKCKFLQKEIIYLGHQISQDGVRPDPDKINAVAKFPTPKSDKNIKQFL